MKLVKNSNSHNFHNHIVDALNEMHDVQTTAFCFEMLWSTSYNENLWYVSGHAGSFEPWSQ